MLDDNFNDHFMEHDEDKVKPVHQETPQEREDREIEESIISRRHNTMRIIILSTIIALGICLFTWTYLHFYRPYSHSVEKGWVMSVATEGSVFKTIECKMLTQDLVLDTMKVQWRGDTIIVDNCNFGGTIANDSLLNEAIKWKASGKRVVVEYDTYSGSLPWRGNTRNVITSIVLDSIQ